MKPIRIEFALSFGRGFLTAAAAGAVLLCAAPELNSEKVTLSTYYPAPSGVYTNMITTGNTLLARDGGSVAIGSAAPTQTLDVNGLIRIRQGNPGLGKVLTSAADGTATWLPAPVLTCATVVSAGAWADCPAGYTVTGCGTFGSSEDDQIQLHNGKDACHNNENHLWARCCKTN